MNPSLFLVVRCSYCIYNVLLGSDSTWGERNNVYSLSLHDLTWKKYENPTYGTSPANRRDHSAVIFRNQMIMYGGKQTRSSASCTNPPAATQFMSDLLVWDMVRGQWIRSAPYGASPPALAGHTAVVDSYTNKMYVFGGTFTSN